MSAQNNSNRLGKGLDALIPTEIEHIDDFASESLPAAAKLNSGNVNEIDITAIDTNPHQPRSQFDDDELAQLAESIKKHGIVQPLVVTAENDWRYQLIAGERRLRAAKLAGLKKVPAVVRTLTEQQQLEIAILENVQRSDLKPLELSVAYSKLVDQFNMTHAKIGASVGKAESTITNSIRLLKLTPKGKQALQEGKITEGHARQLLALPVEAQDTFLAYIIKHDLTVRATEEAARDFKGGVEIKRSKVREAKAQQTQITKDLGKYLGTKVGLLRTAKGGKLQIEYYSDEELGRIYKQILGEE